MSQSLSTFVFLQVGKSSEKTSVILYMLTIVYWTLLLVNVKKYNQLTLGGTIGMEFGVVSIGVSVTDYLVVPSST